MTNAMLGQQVLVVEDDVDIAEVLSIIFERFGHRCRTAASGATGLAAASAQWPDIVFIDIGLPDMSGVELAVRMREQRPDAPLYVVAMTGFSASGSPIVAAFDEYLVKPVAQEILAAAVARASARRLPAA